MKVLERQEIRLTLSDIRVQQRIQYEKGFPEPQGRFEGPHVGTILKHIAVTTGMLERKDSGVEREDFEEDFPLRMALGMWVEQGVQAVWPSLTWQPGEIVVDGVANNPDGLTVDYKLPDGRQVWGINEEIKTTWKSSRLRHDHIDKEWLWTRQQMSYCYSWSRHYEIDIRWSRLHVIWLNGQWDWKIEGGFSPRYNTYLLEFTQRELEQNWQMIQDNKGEV